MLSRIMGGNEDIESRDLFPAFLCGEVSRKGAKSLPCSSRPVFVFKLAKV